MYKWSERDRLAILNWKTHHNSPNALNKIFFPFHVVWESYQLAIKHYGERFEDHPGFPFFFLSLFLCGAIPLLLHKSLGNGRRWEKICFLSEEIYEETKRR